MARVTISSNNLFPGPKGQKGDTGAQGLSGVIAVTSPITNSGSSTSATIGIDQSLIGIAQSQVTNLTSDLAAKAGLALANTFTNSPQQINVASASAKGLIVKGAASQTANLQEWQDSSGTVQAKVETGGHIRIGRLSISTPGAWFDVASLNVTTYGAAVVGAIVKGAASQTADLQQWQNSAGTVLASISSAGLASLPNLTVTSSTAPTNGVYLPAANTLGLATNGGSRLQINSVGEIGISATPVTGFSVQIEKNITGATASYGINNVGFILSGVTSSATYYRTFARTANANFGITAILHYDAAAVGTFDNVTAGGSVTAQYGFRVTNTLTGATTNYGFYGDLAAATGRWNTYMNGAAANYFAGQTTVGSTSLTLGSGSAAQQFGVVASAATRVGAVIRGAASQTANLQEWQNSAGTALSYVRNDGVFFGNQGILSTAWVSSGSYIANAQLISNIGTATNIGVIVRGATSQTADLQQWQDSSATVLAKVLNTGAIYGATLATINSYAIIGEQSSGGSLRLTKLTATGTNPGSGQGRIYFRDGTNAGTLKLVVIAGAAGAETTILDNIPQ